MIIWLADEDYFFSSPAHESHVKIRRHRSEVAKMAWAIGIRKATGNKKWAAIHWVYF